MAVERLEDSPLVDVALSQQDADKLYKFYPDLGSDYLEYCPTCFKNRGEGVDGVLEVDGKQYICNCKDQLQRYKHYLNAGIGITYQRLTWEDFVGDVNAKNYVLTWLQNLQENMMTGKGFILFGPAGTGKTMLSALFLKQVVLRGIECYLTTSKSLIDDTKKGWNDPEFADWHKTKISSARILVIDDLGKELDSDKGNKYAKKQIENLLRVRTQQSRATIFTTNLDCPSGVEKVYGSYFVSLLTETCDLVSVSGSDYRHQANAKRKLKRIY